MTGSERQYDFHVFLSHNAKHKPYVRELVSSLRSRDLSVFFDEDSILAGDDVIQAIEQGLTRSRHVVLVLSEAALESQWVALEWAASLYRDPSAAKRTIIPVLRENCKVPLSLARLKFVDARDEDLIRHVDELVAAIDLMSVQRAAGATVRASSEIPADRIKPQVSFRLPGGAMPVDSPLYVERAQDRMLQSLLSEGAEVLVLWGPRQIGKTSMMIRLLHRAKAQGIAVVHLDCSALGAHTLSQFLMLITSELYRRLLDRNDHNNKTNLFDGDLSSAMQEFSNAFDAVAKPAILALDELDYIRCLEDGGDFMYLLRSLFERRASAPATPSGLRLLVGSFLNPFHLVLETAHTSPFDIGLHLRVESFNRDETTTLFRSSGLVLEEYELEAAQHFTGGHPYLTQQLAYIAVRERIGVAKIIANKQMYLERFGLHLRTLENHIRCDETTRNAIARFKDGELRSPVLVRDIGRLWDLGLITPDANGTFRYSNELYRTIFGGLT
jgi:hypothetical protein